MKYFFYLILPLLFLLQINVELFGQSKTPKPNILLIIVGDMDYSDLGCYGSEIQTPNLDRLAKEGVRLRELYKNSICAPKRASLLTGKYPHKAGIGYFDVNLGLPAYQGYLNKESLTLGEVLRENGYSILLAGKWHVGKDSTSWPLQRGFDHFYGITGGASDFFDVKPLPFGKRAYPVTLLKDNQRQFPKKKVTLILSYLKGSQKVVGTTANGTTGTSSKALIPKYTWTPGFRGTEKTEVSSELTSLWMS